MEILSGLGKGHRIRQRWFSAIKGSFRIHLIIIVQWDQPSKSMDRLTFTINAEKLDVLHVHKGYVSSVQSMEGGSKLLVMVDYLLGHVKDEYRYAVDYFLILQIA